MCGDLYLPGDSVCFFLPSSSLASSCSKRRFSISNEMWWDSDRTSQSPNANEKLLLIKICSFGSAIARLDIAIFYRPREFDWRQHSWFSEWDIQCVEYTVRMAGPTETAATNAKRSWKRARTKKTNQSATQTVEKYCQWNEVWKKTGETFRMRIMFAA